MRLSVLKRLFIIGLVSMATLGGPSGVAPPAAYALPSGPTEPGDPEDPLPGPQWCIPQVVTGEQAVLDGYMYLPNPPMVGQPAEIRISQPLIRFPDPACDDREVAVTPPSYVWYVGARPASSTATTTNYGRDAKLVPDRAGQWTVVYTACPNGCYLSGVHVPPLSKSISFFPIPVVEGRIGSDELGVALDVLLTDTRIQLSHTGGGTPAVGVPVPYTVNWSVPAYKYNELCVAPPDAPDTWQPAPICQRWETEGLQGQLTFHTITPSYNSYIDFGANAVQAGAPDVLPLPIDPVEREVPLDKRAAILAAQILQLGPILFGVDIDRISLLANNLHLDLNERGRWSATIGNGGVTLGVMLRSNNPSIKCLGHYKVKALYYFSLAQGWTDELCPDFNLGQMDLSVKLIPQVVNGALTVGDVQVAVQLEPSGVQSSLIDFFVGATTTAEEQIATKIRTKLLEPQTKTDLGEVLTAALRTKFPDLCSVTAAQVIGSELVVHFVTPPFPGGLCTPPTTNAQS